MREAVVMDQFTSMAIKRAKNPSETKTLLVELEEKAKKVEEITGERIYNRHMMSVIMGILDIETLKHTAQSQGSKVKADILKRKVIEFANLMSIGKSGPDAMDIGRVERKPRWADQVDEGWEEDDGDGEEDDTKQLGAFGTKRHKCGGLGRYSYECPSKDGKGSKSKGNGKTKAKRRALEGLGWRVVNVPLVRTKFGALSQMERDELVTLLQ